MSDMQEEPNYGEFRTDKYFLDKYVVDEICLVMNELGEISFIKIKTSSKVNFRAGCTVKVGTYEPKDMAPWKFAYYRKYAGQTGKLIKTKEPTSGRGIIDDVEISQTYCESWVMFKKEKISLSIRNDYLIYCPE